MDQSTLAEDREFYKDVRAWYKDFMEAHDREVEARVLNQIEAQRAEERRLLEAQRAEERRQVEVNQLVHQFEHRLRRELSSVERGVISSRVQTNGSSYVADLVLDLSAAELANWLEQGEHASTR